MPIEKIARGKDFTLFEGYKNETEIGPECARFCGNLLKKAGIEKYYEDREYKGMAVKD